MKIQLLKLTLLLSIAYNACSMQAPEHYFDEESELIIPDNLSKEDLFNAIKKIDDDRCKDRMLYLTIIKKGLEFRDQNLIDLLIQAIKSKLRSSLSEQFKNLSKEQLNTHLAQMVLSNELFDSRDAMELIILGANPNLIIKSSKYPNGAPVLQYIRDCGTKYIKKLMPLLIIYGVDPNTFCSDAANSYYMVGSKTALMIAAECSLDAMELLINFGANINSQSDEETALSKAVMLRELAQVELLLKYRADVNAHYDSNVNPLCNAITSNNYVMIEILLNHGADLYNGLALDYFLLYQQNYLDKEIVELILSKYPELADRIPAANKHYNEERKRNRETYNRYHNENLKTKPENNIVEADDALEIDSSTLNFTNRTETNQVVTSDSDLSQPESELFHSEIELNNAKSVESIIRMLRELDIPISDSAMLNSLNMSTNELLKLLSKNGKAAL